MTFSGICYSKGRLRQVRLCILYLLHVLYQLNQLYTIYLLHILCQSYPLYGDFVKVPEKVSGTFTGDVADFHCNIAVKSATSQSPRDEVMCIISIMHIISIISIICIILIMCIICRFVRILDLLITCGRTRGH